MTCRLIPRHKFLTMLLMTVFLAGMAQAAGEKSSAPPALSRSALVSHPSR